MTPLKILSYNIHKGFSAGRGTYVLGHIRAAIRLVQPDIVFLQEVQGQHRKRARRVHEWPDSSQFEFLADQVWPHFAYGRNAVFDHGDHGNVILSRYPFISWENLDISLNRLEKRGILHGVIDLANGSPPLHVFCLHLNLFEMDRTIQIRTLCRRVALAVPADCPIIIAGDFNDWRERAGDILERETGVHEAFLSRTGRHARTFPAWQPMLPLDRIYLRGARARGVRLLDGSPWRSLSDHLALYCEVSFQRPSR